MTTKEFVERRRNTKARAMFDEVRHEVLALLAQICGDMEGAEREKLAAKIARVRLKYDYGRDPFRAY